MKDRPAGRIAGIDALVASAAAAHPDRLALATDGGAGPREQTFAALEARVAALAGGLARIAAPGDRVAILSENGGDYAVCYSAVPRAGLMLGPLNQRLHAREWHDALGRMEPAVVIGERALLDALRHEHALATSVHTVVALDDPAPGEIHVDEVVASGAERPVGPAPVDPDTPVWLVGTSGTTGRPKLAMLTHRSLLAAVAATLTARPVGDDDVLLTPFPLCHVAGYNLLVFASRGRPVVLQRRFDVARLLALVPRYRVTQLSLAPTMMAMLLDDPGFDPRALATVRAIGYGASAIPAPTLRRTVETLGVDLSQGYGMTELSGNAVFLGPDGHRRAAGGDARLLDAAGRAAPGVELRIVDSAGRPCGRGEVGEITVRAPQVMSGYWRDPEATGAALVDGWLHTGDAGYVDAEGDLHVVDRIKDVIVSGGENVASREVEEVLRLHPGVRDVAIVGIPDDRWGERVCAVVVADSPGAAPEAELVALSRAHLAAFKTPRRVVYVDALPRNAAGKVLKRELRERLGSTPAT